VILIDTLVDNQVEIDGKWYIAKPIIWNSLKIRLKDAWMVLLGKRYAVCFKQELKNVRRTSIR